MADRRQRTTDRTGLDGCVTIAAGVPAYRAITGPLDADAGVLLAALERRA